MFLFQTTVDVEDERRPLTIDANGRLWLGGKYATLETEICDPARHPFLRPVSTTRGEGPTRVETFAVGEAGHRLRRIRTADGSAYWDVAPELIPAGGGGVARRRRSSQ